MSVSAECVCPECVLVSLRHHGAPSTQGQCQLVRFRVSVCVCFLSSLSISVGPPSCSICVLDMTPSLVSASLYHNSMIMILFRRYRFHEFDGKEQERHMRVCALHVCTVWLTSNQSVSISLWNVSHHPIIYHSELTLRCSNEISFMWVAWGDFDNSRF